MKIPSGSCAQFRETQVEVYVLGWGTARSMRKVSRRTDHRPFRLGRCGPAHVMVGLSGRFPRVTYFV